MQGQASRQLPASQCPWQLFLQDFPKPCTSPMACTAVLQNLKGGWNLLETLNPNNSLLLQLSPFTPSLSLSCKASVCQLLSLGTQPRSWEGTAYESQACGKVFPFKMVFIAPIYSRQKIQ